MTATGAEDGAKTYCRNEGEEECWEPVRDSDEPSGFWEAVRLGQ